jgi:hypothetical protein
MNKSCAHCMRHRNVNGVLRCEERRSKAIGDVIVRDVASTKMAGLFERICQLVAARCGFYQALG